MRNLNSNLLRLDTLQNRMSTGRKINRPSDDPVGLSYSMRYRSGLAANEQFQRNVDASISWVEHTDKMINETNEVLQRARELAVQGANGANTGLSMEAIAEEIDQLYEHIVNIGNSQFNGKYVFNGQMTDVKPYVSSNAENISTHQGDVPLEVGSGITISVNVSGNDLFGAAGDATNAFQVLKDLSNALNAHDNNAVATTLGQLDNRIDLILEKWAEIGARANRVDLIKNRLDNESINLETILSKTEDADMAELMINMKTEENIYQASLSTGARIIKPTLVDFLR